MQRETPDWTQDDDRRRHSADPHHTTGVREPLVYYIPTTGREPCMVLPRAHRHSRVYPEDAHKMKSGVLDRFLVRRDMARFLCNKSRELTSTKIPSTDSHMAFHSGRHARLSTHRSHPFCPPQEQLQPQRKASVSAGPCIVHRVQLRELRPRAKTFFVASRADLTPLTTTQKSSWLNFRHPNPSITTNTFGA